MMVNNNQDDILVSIIIISYNNFYLLRNCLETLYKFTTEINFEVIVVDNNSTEEDIKSILLTYPHITLIRNDKNRGFSAANNQGLRISRGKFVLFLNNDTVFTENSVKKVYEFLIGLKTNALVGCKLLNEDHSIQSSTYRFPTLKNLFVYNFFIYKLFTSSRALNKYYFLSYDERSTTKVDVVIGAFMFANREQILHLKGFDERFFFYHEDTDLCFRFKRETGEVYYFTGTSLIHFGGATTQNNLWFKSKYKSISQIQFLQKHYNGMNFFLSILIHYLGLFIRVPVFIFVGIASGDKTLIKRALYYFRLLFYYPSNVFKHQE